MLADFRSLCEVLSMTMEVINRSSAGTKVVRATFGFVFLVAILVSVSLSSAVEPQPQTPGQFFTNVASRLLQSEFNVDLRHIPIYPTNEYTPEVHRLLQVAVNLYDSTTTNWYPTIFRPRFSAEGTNLFICGYDEVNATNESLLTIPLNLADVTARESIATNGSVNVYGIPWVIGAKKGLPNFNEVSLDSIFQITRMIQITKPTIYSSPAEFSYQQRLLMSLSNSVAVETWNSYSNDFARPVDVLVYCDLNSVLTNSDGFALSNSLKCIDWISTNIWPGRTSSFLPNPESFIIPLSTNLTVIPNLIYHRATKEFLPPGSVDFEIVSANPIWKFKLRCDLRIVIRESETKRVLDYVQLNGPEFDRNLSEEIRTTGFGFQGLWNTNYAASIPALPMGVMNQIQISLGNVSADHSIWLNYGYGPKSSQDIDASITQFRNFYFGESGTNLTQMLPFSPSRKMLLRTSWQANDPLIHYLASDLIDLRYGVLSDSVTPPSYDPVLTPNIGNLNQHYEPWGGNPGHVFSSLTDFSLNLKDPVSSSDGWNFPTGENLSFATIGRIHRGTPWQTLYLKAEDILKTVDVPSGLTVWKNWVGNANPQCAEKTAPINDRHLIDLLAPQLATHDIRELFSLNHPDSAAWRGIFDGLLTPTNSTPEQHILISSNSPQTAIVVEAINHARNMQPHHLFRNLSDLLAVPELTTASPWINPVSPPDLLLSDADLEAIPTQLLPRLRTDSIGTITPHEAAIGIQFTGYDDYLYVIEASADLKNWIPIRTNFPSAGTIQFTAPVSSMHSVFYRSVLLSP